MRSKNGTMRCGYRAMIRYPVGLHAWGVHLSPPGLAWVDSCAQRGALLRKCNSNNQRQTHTLRFE